MESGVQKNFIEELFPTARDHHGKECNIVFDPKAENHQRLIPSDDFKSHILRFLSHDSNRSQMEFGLKKNIQ